MLTTPEGPVESKTDMKVHPSNEEIRIIGGPYVSGGIGVKKKVSAETTIAEDYAIS